MYEIWGFADYALRRPARRRVEIGTVPFPAASNKLTRNENIHHHEILHQREVRRRTDFLFTDMLL